MIRKLWGRVLCLFERHDWTKWRKHAYKEPSAATGNVGPYKTRLCKRKCGATETRK